MGQGPAQPTQEPAGSEFAVTAALAYLWILAILWLLIDPYRRNRFIRFHSFQALALGVVMVLVGALLGQVPVVGIFLVILWELFAFVLWVACVVMAAKGEWFKLPVIGDFAAVEFRHIPTLRVSRPVLKCAGCAREPLPGVFVPGRVVVGGGLGRCEKCGKVWCSNCARRYDHGSYFLHACPRCDAELTSDLLGG